MPVFLRFSIQRQERLARRTVLLLLTLLLFQNLLPLLGQGVKLVRTVQAADSPFVIVDEPADELQFAICGMPLWTMGFDKRALPDVQLVPYCPACLLYHLIGTALPSTSPVLHTTAEARATSLSEQALLIVDRYIIAGQAIRAPPLS